ncbi:MAG TPA: phosphotransferase [Ktedonobacterales bacterium]
MLTPPDLAPKKILAILRDTYGLSAIHASFLPIGADVNSAVYRIETEDDTAYFLKLRRADFDEIAVAVPAYLRAQGIAEVMSPLATIGGRLWASALGFQWMLYPYFEGHNGFETPLSDTQWMTLGRSLRDVHSALLPPDLAARVPREDYSPRWRDIVQTFDAAVDTRVDTDLLAREFAEFWATKHNEICTMVERAEQLARVLRGQANEFVLCHFDLHAGNVLLGAHGTLAIVDWDNPLLAPKERDLMFMGGGVGNIWNTPREEALFYRGYGLTQIDAVALSYYRYERIVADLATYGDEIFNVQASEEDRTRGLRGTMAQFLPGRVVEIAHRTYQKLQRGYGEHSC